MRVLAITNLFPNPAQPRRGQFNRQQFRALAVKAAVRVIAPIAWTDELRSAVAARPRWPSARLGATRLPADRRVRCDGVLVEHPRYYYPPKVLRGRYGHCYRWSIRPAFERAVQEFQPSVVYSAWAYPDGWAATALAREAGLPSVVKVHGSDILTLLRSAARRRQTAAGLRAADAVVAVSRDLRQRVIDLGVDPERVHVIYDGINRDLFSPGDRLEARRRLAFDEHAPLILFVGNLLPVKGLDVLVEACDRLAARGVRSTCVLIGQGPLASRLRREIIRRDLKDRVRLLGPRPHEELPDWFRAAHVFVLPSRSEGVPNVLLEAAACRTPFVASRVGGIPELTAIGANRLVTPGDAEELAEAIAERLAPADEAARQAYRPWHSHADTADQLLELFSRVVNARSLSGISAAAEASTPTTARQEVHC
jgi:glycosyltransferase involved in cell wall biosynthesis